MYQTDLQSLNQKKPPVGACSALARRGLFTNKNLTVSHVKRDPHHHSTAGRTGGRGRGRMEGRERGRRRRASKKRNGTHRRFCRLPRPERARGKCVGRCPRVCVYLLHMCVHGQRRKQGEGPFRTPEDAHANSVNPKPASRVGEVSAWGSRWSLAPKRPQVLLRPLGPPRPPPHLPYLSFSPPPRPARATPSPFRQRKQCQAPGERPRGAGAGPRTPARLGT